MSKNSAKQRYTQLMEWLSVNGKKRVNTRKTGSQSRLEYYKSKQA